MTLQVAPLVDDGFVSISLSNSSPQVNNPKLSGIEIKILAPHLAHSVPGGPYSAVDTTNLGSASVPVNGVFSHTHASNKVLTDWIWKEGAAVLATGEKTAVNLSVGEHTVALTVIDNGGNKATAETTVSIRSFGFSAVKSLSPTSGTISGNAVVTITGSGFTYAASQTTVHFGLASLTGSAVTIVNSSTIKVTSPAVAIGAPVAVSVETPLGKSNEETFTYLSNSPIDFSSGKLTSIGQPTSAAFGPDGKLYVGTIDGMLAKLTLNDDFTAVISQVVSNVQPYRAILGIAFDPLDTSLSNPAVYCTSSYLFHGETKSSSGQAINGIVHRVSGANLDVVTNVITGLPVSDHDHGTLAHIGCSTYWLFVRLAARSFLNTQHLFLANICKVSIVSSLATLVNYISKSVRTQTEAFPGS